MTYFYAPISTIVSAVLSVVWFFSDDNAVSYVLRMTSCFPMMGISP